MPTYDASQPITITVSALPPPQCSAGQTKCEGGVKYTCDSGFQWFNTGEPCEAGGWGAPGLLALVGGGIGVAGVLAYLLLKKK